MRKKETKPFYFKDLTHEDMVAGLNSEYPIDLRHNTDLIDRVCERYPLIPKSEVIIIIREVFQSLRESLILGKVLNFYNLFFSFRLYISEYNRNGN